MSLTDFLNIVPGYPVLSVLIWFVVAIVMLYLARSPAHRAIKSLSRVIHCGMRLASRSVLLAEKRLVYRNKEVLLAAGRESVERLIEREFQRVDAVVRRDLSGYPALQHKLAEQIARIDEDYPGVVFGHMLEKRVVLEHKTHPPITHPAPVDILSIKQHFSATCIRELQPGDDAQ